MKKYIITGASGFIGKALTEKMLANGNYVYAIVRNAEKLNHLKNNKNLKIIQLDLNNICSLNETIEDEYIEAFIHLANSAKYPDENHDYSAQLWNTKLACDSLMEAVKIKSNKFLLIGTSYQYQKNYSNVDKVYRESSIYGAARKSAELLCRTLAHKYNIGFNTILLTNCFGIGDTSLRSANSIILKLLNDEIPKLIEGNNKHDWVYIDDFVNGLISVVEKGIDFKTYYIGHQNLKTFKELIKSVRDAIAPHIVLEFGTYYDTSYIDYNQIDLDKLYNDTGFKCKADFKESIIKTAKWIKESGEFK